MGQGYTGAKKIRVPHKSLQPGNACPECRKGKVYEMKKPGVLIRIVGQAPVEATVFELQKLRCNLCGTVFTATAPEGAGSDKYDATAASMIALLKYGSGLPFNRLEGLQGNLGIPLPASTQWDIVSNAAKKIEPVYEELIRQAAQGEVVYNDDTTMKILELMGKRAKAKALAGAEDAPERSVRDSPREEVHGTAGHVPARVALAVAHREQGFGVLRRHAQEARNPHPEEGTGPSGCDRGRDPGDVAGAHGGRERGHQRLEVGDVPLGSRVAPLDQGQAERGKQLAELEASKPHRQVPARPHEEGNQDERSPDEARDRLQNGGQQIGLQGWSPPRGRGRVAFCAAERGPYGLLACLSAARGFTPAIGGDLGLEVHPADSRHRHPHL